MAEFPEEARVAEALHHDSAPSVGAMAMAKLMTHEEICAIRYQGIIDRVGRLETIILRAAGVLLLGMGGIIAAVFFHLPK